MAIEEYDGIVINKMTLKKYKELKAANQLVASQSYVISDLDEILESLELPARLSANSNDNRIENDDIDTMFTGFAFWDCNDTTIRPLNYEEFYFVIANTYLSNGQLSCGVQIAIGEGSNFIFKRNRIFGENGWNDWKRVLDTDDNLYWQLRVGRVITADFEIIMHNQNTINMSSLPINTILMTIETQNNQVFNYKIILSDDGLYKFRIYLSDNSYYETLARGSLLSSMDFDLEYDTFTSSGVGKFAKITYIHEDLLNIIDNLMRINNCDF